MGDTEPKPFTAMVTWLTGAKITEREAVLETLPAASMLRARMVLVPAASVSVADQLVAPFALTKEPLFNCTSTRARAALSLAVPVTVTVALVNFALAAGVEMATEGAVTSAKLASRPRPGCMTKLRVALALKTSPLQPVKE